MIKLMMDVKMYVAAIVLIPIIIVLGIAARSNTRKPCPGCMRFGISRGIHILLIT
jgi:hypothetical protein